MSQSSPASAGPADGQAPIRIKVVYTTAHSLVTEFTTSLSKGGCRILTRRALAVGTRFEFDMFARGEPTPVQMRGQVIGCRAQPELADVHALEIEYIASDAQRAAIERVLERLLSDHRQERARRDVRVPVNLVVDDARRAGRRLLLRDVSLGGVGLRLAEGDALARELRPGAPAWLEVALDGRRERLRFAVVWSVEAKKGFMPAAVGLELLSPTPSATEMIEKLLRLRRPESIRGWLGGEHEH